MCETYVRALNKINYLIIVFFFVLVVKKKVQANEFLTLAKVQEAVDILRGAVTIVYPMGLPPHDPIRLEFENQEDLGGQQVFSLTN